MMLGLHSRRLCARLAGIRPLALSQVHTHTRTRTHARTSTFSSSFHSSSSPLRQQESQEPAAEHPPSDLDVHVDPERLGAFWTPISLLLSSVFISVHTHTRTRRAHLRVPSGPRDQGAQALLPVWLQHGASERPFPMEPGHRKGHPGGSIGHLELLWGSRGNHHHHSYVQCAVEHVWCVPSIISHFVYIHLIYASNIYASNIYTPAQS
jgi:hypothetical protein